MDSKQLLRPPVVGSIAALILAIGVFAYFRRQEHPAAVVPGPRPSPAATQRPAPSMPKRTEASTPTPEPTPSPSPSASPIPPPRFTIGSASQPANRQIRIDGYIELVEAPDEASTDAAAAEMIRLLGSREVINRSVIVNYGPTTQATSNSRGEFDFMAELTEGTTELGLTVSSTILEVEGGGEHYSIQIPVKGDQVSVSIPMVFAVKFLPLNDGNAIRLEDMRRPEILSEMRRLLGTEKPTSTPAP